MKLHRSPKYHKITAYIYSVVGIIMVLYGLSSSSNMTMFFGMTMSGLACFRWWLYKKSEKIKS